MVTTMRRTRSFRLNRFTKSAVAGGVAGAVFFSPFIMASVGPGTAVGDSIGAPIEFATADIVSVATGTIEQLGAHGIWLEGTAIASSAPTPTPSSSRAAPASTTPAAAPKPPTPVVSPATAKPAAGAAPKTGTPATVGSIPAGTAAADPSGNPAEL